MAKELTISKIIRSDEKNYAHCPNSACNKLRSLLGSDTMYFCPCGMFRAYRIDDVIFWIPEFCFD